MNKKYYRFFGGLITTQEKWLNKMAEKGYRLIRTKRLLYEFQECTPELVKYRIDFIGQKSKIKAQDYHSFLEDMGYKVFYKNINLNYSIGKVRYRPWAEKGGRIATNSTTFNRELLIVEKENDGTPFELHTSFEDKIKYYKSIRNPWFTLFALTIIFAISFKFILLGAFAIMPLIPVMIYQYHIEILKKEVQTKEW